jgi:protein ThiW
MNIKKITYSAIFIAIGVVCSPFNIPLGFAKCFPVQHLINVICAIILGPIYAVSCAFAISFLRNIMGMGTLLAFPGSMIGALLSGILYKKTNKISLAFVGEVIGTGLIGALISYPIATVFMNKQVAMFTYVIPFGISTLVGSIFAVILLKALEKTNILEKVKQ